MSVPDWVITKRISEVSIPQEHFQIDMDEWPKIARERANKLIQGQRWFPASGALRANYEREVYEEYAGHGLLRFVAAENSRVFGWLIEQEGDLFEWRFKNAKTLQEKIAIAKYFFGDDKVIEPKEVWTKFDINHSYFKDFKMKNKRIEALGIYFACIPKMVSLRSQIIRNGWIVGSISDFSSGVKVAFERLLRDRIKEAGERMDRTVRGAVRELQEELGKQIHAVSHALGKVNIEDYDLFNRQDIFPQCMLDLYNEVMEKGHLGHQERFQLGLFLKRLGMSIDEQLRFWYERAVDNIGMTYEQFASSTPGYIIRHMYGMEGGETDYDAPSCSRIQGEYYCTFLHQSVEEIDKSIRKEFKNPTRKLEDNIRLLESKVIDKKPSEACAVMFNLRYRRGAKPIRHPIGYSTYAARCKGIIRKEEDPQQAGKKK